MLHVFYVVSDSLNRPQYLWWIPKYQVFLTYAKRTHACTQTVARPSLFKYRLQSPGLSWFHCFLLLCVHSVLFYFRLMLIHNIMWRLLFLSARPLNANIANCFFSRKHFDSSIVKFKSFYEDRYYALTSFGRSKNEILLMYSLHEFFFFIECACEGASS